MDIKLPDSDKIIGEQNKKASGLICVYLSDDKNNFCKFRCIKLEVLSIQSPLLHL